MLPRHVNFFRNQFRAAIGRLWNRKRVFISRRIARAIRRNAAGEHDSKTSGMGRVRANMLRAGQIRFVIFIGLVARFAMYRGQIDDQICLLRQWHSIQRQTYIARNIHHTRQSPIRRLHPAQQWLHIIFLARRTNVSEINPLNLRVFQQMLRNMCSDASGATKNHAGAKVHAGAPTFI